MVELPDAQFTAEPARAKTQIKSKSEATTLPTELANVRSLLYILMRLYTPSVEDLDIFFRASSLDFAKRVYSADLVTIRVGCSKFNRRQ